MSIPPSAGGDATGDRRQVSRLRLYLYLGALTIALFTVLVLWHTGLVPETNDIYRFAAMGRNIAEGHGLSLVDGVPTIRRAPLYPGMIAALYLVFGVKPMVIQFFQAFLAAGTCVLVFEIGRRVFSLRAGIIACVLAALHPMVMRYVPDIQVETTMTFLYTLTVFRTVRLVEHESLQNGFWVGIAAAAAAMVKGVALPYAALFIVCYLLWRRRNRVEGDRTPLPGWKPIAAMLVAMGLVILPWTFRNYEVTGGRFVLISGNASGEFLRGYVFAAPRYYLLRDNPYTVGENEANAMQVDLFQRQGLIWERDEAETERVQNAAMKEKLRSQPMAFVRKVAIASFMFWYVTTSRLNSFLIGGLALGGWALALYGWFRQRRAGHKFWLIFLPIASLNLIYALVLAVGRYSAPCIPSLMVLAAFGVDTLLRRFASRRAKA